MVYFIQDTGSGNIKIGYTKEDAEKRLKELQTGSSHQLDLIATIPSGDRKTEKKLHKMFGNMRVCGEWFRPEYELLETISQYRIEPFMKDDELVGYVVVEQDLDYGHVDKHFHVRRVLYAENGVPYETVDPIGETDNVSEANSMEELRRQMTRGYLAVLSGRTISLDHLMGDAKKHEGFIKRRDDRKAEGIMNDPDNFGREVIIEYEKKGYYTIPKEYWETRSEKK